MSVEYIQIILKIKMILVFLFDVYSEILLMRYSKCWDFQLFYLYLFWTKNL